jgi:hypothetical protein
MKGSQTTVSFRKTAECPASATLLSYRADDLSADAAKGIGDHLKLCDFCNAELRLLAHHQSGGRTYRVPEIPINLRILAESILSRG